MTGAEWERIRERTVRLPALAGRYHPADPWQLCRDRWRWWGSLSVRPFAEMARALRAVAFRCNPWWRRRRARRSLALACESGRRAAVARRQGEAVDVWHHAQAVAFWREARTLNAGHWS